MASGPAFVPAFALDSLRPACEYFFPMKQDELYEFARIVAHDLKAPLRGIASLVEAFEEMRAGHRQADPALAALLTRRVQRLLALLDRVQEYALLGREMAVRQRVDTARLVEEAVRELAPPPQLVVTVEPLPAVDADPERLKLLFVHLLQNAVKFRARPEGAIRVFGGETAEGWRLSVQDDGLGIEAEFLETVFLPGKTLVPQDAVEGSGMGLALARKIVALHGGRIWAESEVGRGTTVHLTLPRAVPEAAPPAGVPEAGTEAGFRRLMTALAGAVSVVTTRDSGGDPLGLTASAVCLVSWKPPLLLVCVDQQADCHQALAERPTFGVNVLSADQVAMSQRFAQKDCDKFAGLAWEPGRTGVPLLPDALARLECRIVARHPAGDHTILLGEAVEWQLRDGQASPLLYYRRRYHRLGDPLT